MGGVGWLSLRGDAWHGPGHGTLGTVDPALRAEPDDALSLSGAGICRHHCCSRARGSSVSTASGRGAVDIRWSCSSVLALAVVVFLNSYLRLLDAVSVRRWATRDTHVLSRFQTESS